VASNYGDAGKRCWDEIENNFPHRGTHGSSRGTLRNRRDSQIRIRQSSPTGASGWCPVMLLCHSWDRYARYERSFCNPARLLRSLQRPLYRTAVRPNFERLARTPGLVCSSKGCIRQPGPPFTWVLSSPVVFAGISTPIPAQNAFSKRSGTRQSQQLIEIVSESDFHKVFFEILEIGQSRIVAGPNYNFRNR